MAPQSAQCFLLTNIAQVVSVVFFVFFVLITGFVLMSLFIGSVCSGMVISLSLFHEKEFRERAEHKAKLGTDTPPLVAIKIDPY